MGLLGVVTHMVLDLTVVGKGLCKICNSAVGRKLHLPV